MNKFSKTIIIALFIFVSAVFISSPSKYMQSFFDGITIWARNVLPALFPFMVLTTLTFKVTKTTKHSFTGRLFGVSCDNIFILSILCGYPVGAKAISDSDIDCQTATKLCSFCSSAGPIFMIATVGAKLLQSTAATAALIISQIAGVLLNGFVYRRYPSQLKASSQTNGLHPADIGDTITSSALSVISVGGLIALFYMLTDIIKSVLPQNVSNSLIFSFCVGLLEMTNGIIGVARLTDTFTATVLSSTLLSLGGICVFMQCYSYLGKKEVRAREILQMKITQAAFATIICYILCTLLAV